MVFHFGAVGDEAPFEQILGPNIVGAYNVWEAAHRPDTFYGLAKCFAEDLARMYWGKKVMEAVCLRILSCAQVNSAWALGT